MNIAKLPLDERLRRLDRKHTAHPEYVPSIIDSIRKIKITAYMEGYEEQLETLRQLMELTPAAIKQWSYRDLAIHIDNWYRSGNPGMKSSAVVAMNLLAIPWFARYKTFQMAQEKGVFNG